jgi:hypothetical protein
VGGILISESDTGYAPVFQAIRRCSWLSTSIFGYPPVFLAIRQYFWLSLKAYSNDRNTESQENFLSDSLGIFI